MAGALASAALLVAGSLVIGQAALVLCGRRQWTPLAGPIGLALALVLCGVVAGWGGRGTALAIALSLLTAAAVAVVVLRGERTKPSLAALGALGLATLAGAIPFIAAGRVGILGVGLVNDDMASHLLLADWIRERFHPEPRLIDQGYPLGPHALVAGLASVLGASSIEVFAGLTLAIPGLTALVAFSALKGLRPWVRSLAAAVVALPYLVSAYLAQEAFKEPIIALFVLTLALLLPRVKDWRDAIPLGVLAAGTTYVYSFPGLAWLGGVAAIWAALELWRGSGERLPAVSPRILAVAAAVGTAIAVLLILPELSRLIDFADFRALHPSQANEGGLGNLPGQLSPLEALGIWPTSDFRLSAAASSLPALIFYGGGLFALIAVALGLPGWIKRNGTAVVAALVAAAALYLAARALGTVYTSAKALAIAAPLLALVALGGLLGSARRPLVALGAVFALAVAGSSFLILRQAPVAPDTHAHELAQIRPLVAGQKLLFLGRDNFVLYELRGSRPFTHVRNFYDPYFVDPDPAYPVTDLGAKFDFDSVPAETLAKFPYVLTTQASYASGPPPGYEAVLRTGSYVLWKKTRSPIGRQPGETDAEPGRTGGCAGAAAPKQVSSFAEPPVLAPATDWSSTTVEGGGAATVELELPPGIWDLSLQYDATRPLTLSDGGSFSDSLPANLDYRGTAAFWPAGTVEVEQGGPLTVTATVERPPLAGRLLGAHSVAHLGPIAATSAKPPSRSCDGYVDWYRR